MFRNVLSTMSRLSLSTMLKQPNNMFTVCRSPQPQVGINGFGRIGKSMLRKSFEMNVNVVAVNQPFTDVQTIANSLACDTVHGHFFKKVKIYGNCMCIGSRQVKVYHEKNPEKICWGELPIDYVIDSSGQFTDKEKAMSHFKAGVKKVIITAPSKDAPMFVKGVNFDVYNKCMSVVSNSSCTTNCAAPLIHLMHRKFGVVNCLLTTTHSMTTAQQVHDGINHRSGPNNIMHSTTGAATAIGMVIPELKDKVKGNAVRVPVLDVSLLKLYINLKNCVSEEAIKDEIKQRADCDMKDVLHYVDGKFVSSDFIDSQFSAVVDLKQVQVVGTMVSIGAWYDNEVGYSCRVLDLVKHMIAVEKCS